MDRRRWWRIHCCQRVLCCTESTMTSQTTGNGPSGWGRSAQGRTRIRLTATGSTYRSAGGSAAIKRGAAEPPPASTRTGNAEINPGKWQRVGEKAESSRNATPAQATCRRVMRYGASKIASRNRILPCWILHDRVSTSRSSRTRANTRSTKRIACHRPPPKKEGCRERSLLLAPFQVPGAGHWALGTRHYAGTVSGSSPPRHLGRWWCRHRAGPGRSHPSSRSRRRRTPPAPEPRR